MSVVRRILSRVRGGVAAVVRTTTALGATVAAVAVGALVAGRLLGWRELTTLAATAAVLLPIAGLFLLGRVQLDASISVQPSRVVTGERAMGRLRLANGGRRTLRHLRVELPVGRSVAVFSPPSLPAGDEHDELFVVPTQRRAVIPVGPVRSVQGDPLGLYRRVRQWSAVEEIYVHPRTVRMDGITAGLLRDLEGQPTNALSPSDVAFHTLRDYVPGDDRRHVHWKSSAKLGTLQVRQYVDTRRSHVAVLLSLDLDQYADAEEFELAVSCAASVAQQAARDEQTLSVFAGDVRLVAGRGRSLLDRFSELEPGPGAGGVASAVRSLHRLAPDASVAVACTGSRATVAGLQACFSSLHAGLAAVAFVADASAEPAVRRVGSTAFVSVPHLDTLSRNLGAVAA